MGRARYKVFLGMAAGVGKTYRMLQEGRAELNAGRDVVVAYLEPHDRPETSMQAEGVEQLPRRKVEYRGTFIEEMDLPAIFQRAPQLCLIDELAHTNAPGTEHRKRYEDIADVLDAGIDVFSTVNVQHLESLNDRIHELTGVRVRETFPDSVLNDADEVVLIDLTPEALIQRLREGKVYPAERVPKALNSFFRVENLATLREVALREVAEEVEAKRTDVPTLEPAGAVRERLLALVTPSPRSRRLARRAWRSAQRLGGELDLLYVTAPGERPSDDDRQGLEELRSLARDLGAELLVEEGDDLAEVAGRVAADRGTTYAMIGQPERARGLKRLGEPFTERLMRELPGIDLRVLADRPSEEE